MVAAGMGVRVLELSARMTVTTQQQQPPQQQTIVAVGRQEVAPQLRAVVAVVPEGQMTHSSAQRVVQQPLRARSSKRSSWWVPKRRTYKPQRVAAHG
jgi:hypothetical protein